MIPEGKRIEVQADGPYVVIGEVRLVEMAPVHTFNGEPIEWHTLREIGDLPRPLELCRCGASDRRPFCDRVHCATGEDAAETASRDSFRMRARIYTYGAEMLGDDKPLCMDAGFCGTRTTTVLRLFTGEDDQSRRGEMQGMVWRCPSGRLVLYGPNGEPEEPNLPQEIAVLPGGPLWVRGGIPIVAADGTLWEPRNRVTLCRCGASANKPFCDKSHQSIHFDER
jgi:CDGSH-type Zn-finger protein